jgi:hypothetical protein
MTTQGTDVSMVTLNGVPAAIIAQSTIRVTVIAGAGTSVGKGDVMVRSASRGDVSMAGGFTYMSGACHVLVHFAAKRLEADPERVRVFHFQRVPLQCVLARRRSRQHRGYQLGQI